MEKIVSQNGKLYIRGAGGQGRQLFNELSDLGIKVTAFLDISFNELQTISSVPVISPDEIYENLKGTYFVIVAIKNNEAYREITADMQRNGLIPGENFGDFGIDPDLRMKPFMNILPEFDRHVFQKKFFEIRIKDMQSVCPNFCLEFPDAFNVIANLDVVITTNCSLKCSYCSHCIPYCKQPKHFDVEQVISDLDKTLSISFIACVAIMGGEPFLHPKFKEFIALYAKLKNKRNIGFTRIVTNSTLLPSDEVLTAFSKIENAYMYISNYGEKSKKMNQLIDACVSHGIPHYIAPLDNNWVTLGDFDFDRHYTEDELCHLFAVCDASVCTQLINGNLYNCARTPILNEDGLIPYCSEDFCDIRNTPDEIFNEKLHSYLYGTKYLNGCKYCDGQHIYSEQIKRGI
jgi:hypothetical protein